MVRAGEGRHRAVRSEQRELRRSRQFRCVLRRTARTPVPSPLLRHRESRRRRGADAGRLPEALGTVGSHRRARRRDRLPVHGGAERVPHARAPRQGGRAVAPSVSRSLPTRSTTWTRRRTFVGCCRGSRLANVPPSCSPRSSATARNRPPGSWGSGPPTVRVLASQGRAALRHDVRGSDARREGGLRHGHPSRPGPSLERCGDKCRKHGSSTTQSKVGAVAVAAVVALVVTLRGRHAGPTRRRNPPTSCLPGAGIASVDGLGAQIVRLDGSSRPARPARRRAGLRRVQRRDHAAFTTLVGTTWQVATISMDDAGRTRRS